MINKLLTLLAILMFAFAAYAADSKPLPTVKINASSMQYFGNESRSQFSGNVVAVSEDYTLMADYVDIFITKANDINKIKCKGRVNFKSGEIIGISNEAELDQVVKLVKLRGDVKIWQGENYLEGERVDIKYETSEITIDRGRNEKVTIIFNSADNISAGGVTVP